MIDAIQPGDVEQLKVRPGDALGVPPKDEVGFGWTMKKGGRPIGCGGFFTISEGVGMVWVILSDEVRGHGKKLCQFARDATQIAFEEMGWHRIQSAVRCDKPEYQRWAELMGFEKEGRLRKATPDKVDLFLYARVI